MTGLYSDIAVMTTACKRPYYFQETLSSWEEVRGIEGVQRIYVSLGQHERNDEILRIMSRSPLAKKPGLVPVPDPQPGWGMHRAIAETVEGLFNSPLSWLPEPDFVICGEEDVKVSDDVLEYFAWAKNEFANDQEVAAVCAHSVGGQYWDKHEPADDADADQWQVRVLDYFNAWCWGTWVDRWSMFYQNWDFDCTSGNATGTHSGWDWNIASRILPDFRKKCVVPDASRSQNIGRLEGWASNDWSFAFSQAQSFRAHRKRGIYKMMDGEM